MRDRSTPRYRTRRQADVGRFALLLVTVVATIALLGLIGVPRLQDDPTIAARIATTGLTGLILIATIRITRTSERSQHIAGSFIALVALAGAVSLLVSGTLVVTQILGILWVLMVIATPVFVLREVLSGNDVTRQTIIGAISVYLQIGIALTFVAMAIDNWGAFFETAPRPTAYAYFSFVTITTLGYGDLSPYSDGARMVSIAFAVVAQMYLVIVVARLVALWKPDREALADEDDE
jgi:Ion channel